MKNLYIIGDSHTTRIGHILFNNISKKLEQQNILYSTYLGTSFDKVAKLDPYGYPLKLRSEFHSIKFDDSMVHCAAYLGRPAITFNYSHHYMESWDNDSNTIMPFLGYIDIKNYLPNKNLANYKNVSEVVDIYVNNTVNKFKNAKIIFVNPFPQFEVIVSARWRKFSVDPDISFEERHEVHLEFCEKLKDKCASVGLEQPIDISQILGVPWIGPTMQYKTPLEYLYNDHCTPEHYDKILDYFLHHTGFNIGH